MVVKRCFVILLFSLKLHAESSIGEEGQKAKAFAQTRDFKQASFLYEELLQRPLPDWQKNSILYNLGTIKLFQQQWEQALTFFYRISLPTVSSPYLLRLLNTNEGIAYLGQAKALSFFQPHQDAEEQADLVRQSIKQFNQASKIDCRMQRLENSSATCEISPDLRILLETAQSLLHQIQQKQREKISSLPYPQALTSLLINSLKELTTYLKTIPPTQDYTAYLYTQADALSSLWEPIKNEQGRESYTEAIKAIQAGNREKAQESLETALATLASLPPPSALESLIFRYYLTLTEDLKIATLQSLLLQQQMLEVKESSILTQATAYLETGMRQLEEGDSTQARFFVLASLMLLEDLLPTAVTQTPQSVLSQALRKAQGTLQLTRLTSLTEQPSKEMRGFIKSQQTQVVAQAKPFIQTALQEQAEHFSDSDLSTRCQKTPWDQVIPLFEEGYQAAEQATLWIESLNLALLSQQKQTIHAWQQALDLLKRPPPSSSSQEQENKQSSEQTSDTLRLIQEMQAQDQPQQQEEVPQELRSW